MTGSKKTEYYPEELGGLNYPNRFMEQWNTKYRQLPITIWGQDIRHQSPPGWSYKLRTGACHMLSYEGEAPLGQGLNHLVWGPSTIDCGVYCQLLLWMAIRYLIGDKLFNELFDFKMGQFAKQDWDQPDKGTASSLLYFLYDNPLRAETSVSEPRTSIQIRSFFNHPDYLAKHPGGEGRLQNVIQIDNYYIIFDSLTPRNFLSAEELK